MNSIFFFEAFAEEEEALRRYLGDDASTAAFFGGTIQEWGNAEIPPAPVVSVRTQSRIPLSWAPHLQGVLSRSTGYDHLLRYRRESGRLSLPAGYLPLYCHQAVAEQAMLLWTSLLRRLPEQIAAFPRFHRDGLTGGECAGSTLAVFGVGKIGYACATIARALGMEVLGVDIERRHPGIRYVSPAEALRRARVVVCAMSLTARTESYFTPALLAEAKPGTVFVNVSRGEISPPAHLLHALQSGQLGGVALDVYPEETALGPWLRESGMERTPPTPEFASLVALHRHSRVILTPHNAFNTLEAVERKSAQSIRQWRHLRQTGKFLWSIPQDSNAPVPGD